MNTLIVYLEAQYHSAVKLNGLVVHIISNSWVPEGLGSLYRLHNLAPAKLRYSNRAVRKSNRKINYITNNKSS